jgi:serine phosphatase RsbU (regulator of sigma subunit)
VPDLPTLDVGALLDAAEAAPPAEGVDAVAEALAQMLGATEVSFLIADISGGALIRLARAPRIDPAARRSTNERVPINDSGQGDALRTQQVRQVPSVDGTWIYAPVTQRGESVGVLELLLSGPVDDDVVRSVSRASHALAFVVIADRRFSDLYEWGQRSSQLSLAAEIQRRLLPASYTCEAGQFSLSGWLIPANEAGGDTFDSILDREILQLSITDAMGHGVQAAHLATLAVGSLRNSRRNGAGVLEMAQTASQAVAEHAGPDQFVTGQVLRIELATGHVQLVNAGHQRPMLVRGGVATQLAIDADPVFGVLPDRAYSVQHLQLEAGDRLVLLTDGMYERNAEAAAVDQLLPTLQDLHPRESVQALTAAVLAATHGDVLDDATALVLDWYGGPARDRATTAGAGTGLASC